MSRDISAEITDRIIKAIEHGGLKWVRGWRTRFPVSLATGKTYKGINALLLLMSQEAHGYKSPFWVTFREAQRRGATVLKGEKASPIVFYEMRERIEKNDDGTEERRTFPFMRLYYVFNVAQTTLSIKEEAQTFTPIQCAEKVAQGYNVTVKYGGSQPCYVLSADEVRLPVREDFVSAEAYYATLFHEYAHSTGAKHRLNRELSTQFGSEAYAYEELIAELSSAFLCAETGIEGESIQNNASYVASWLKALKDDKRLIFKASKSAQEATDFIKGKSA